MSGTKSGGQKAAETNKRIHGEDFYARIGRMGGKAGHTGGFASDLSRARSAGAMGGRVGMRGYKLLYKNKKNYIYINRITGEVVERRVKDIFR